MVRLALFVHMSHYDAFGEGVMGEDDKIWPTN